MKQLLAVVLGVLGFAAALPGQAPLPPSLTLGGRVVDAASQRPLPGAAVTIRGTAPLPEPPTLVADAAGRFRFDQLRPGRYSVVAAALGYLTGGEHIEDGMAPPEVTVILEAGESPLSLTLGLTKPVAIAGFVVDSDNSPVESAQMGALREIYVAGVRRFAVGSATASNDAGQFRFNNLAPGRYIVCVIGERLTVPRSLQRFFEEAAAGSESDRMAFTALIQRGGMELGSARGFAVGDFWLKPGNVSVGPLVTSDGQVWSAPDTCNGGARNPLSAPLITLAAGEQRLAETLVVDLEHAPSVSGVVTGPAGPIAWQGVTLESEGFDALGWLEGLPYSTTTTDGAGRFTFLGVAPGNYVLKTYRLPMPIAGEPPDALADAKALSARMPISVGLMALDDVSVVMEAAQPVRGRVVFAGSAVPPSGNELTRIAVTFASADGVTTRMPRLRPTVNVQPDGTFRTVGLMSGRYVVSVAPMGPWRLDKAELNGVDVSDVPFVVSDETLPEIVVTLTDAQWRVSGTVRDAKSLPMATGRVLIFPADRTRWVGQGAQPRRQRLVEVKNGAYAIDGLPGGEYFIVALAAGAAGEWQSPDRLAQWATGAMRVVLIERESRTLDLTVGGGR